MTGEPLIFYQVVYRPTEGFPAANELITNTTCAEECCIECQTTVSISTRSCKEKRRFNTTTSLSAQDPSSSPRTNNAIYASLNPEHPLTQLSPALHMATFHTP
jgi:hypothetical protein